MTFKNALIFLAAVMLTIPVIAQQTPSQADWNHYFNARFLPENSPESNAAAQRVEHPQLKSRVDSRPESKTSRARQDHVPAASSAESTQSLNSKALADDIETSSDAISVIQLPDRISTAEQSGAAAQLKEFYVQFRSDYPLHPNVYNYAQNLLQSVSPGGWLVVQGQLDTYPLRALQIAEGARSDVQTVNLNWLQYDAAYRQQIAAKLPRSPGWQSGDNAQQLIQKMQLVVSGKLHLSMTVSTEVLQSFQSSLQPMGLAFLLSENALPKSRHHEILAGINWNKVTTPALPEYVKALQQNYVAALLLDEKLGNPEKLGSTKRGELLEELYEQRSLRPASEKYLQSK